MHTGIGRAARTTAAVFAQAALEKVAGLCRHPPAMHVSLGVMASTPDQMTMLDPVAMQKYWSGFQAVCTYQVVSSLTDEI